MRKLFAAVAALSLTAAPVAAQPPQATETQQEAEDRDGGLEGELWGYLALPALIVVILLIAVAMGEEEDSVSP
jgi:lipopolysaccharide export LptBFGC system permease protein LptF